MVSRLALGGEKKTAARALLRLLPISSKFSTHMEAQMFSVPTCVDPHIPAP